MSYNTRALGLGGAAGGGGARPGGIRVPPRGEDERAAPRVLLSMLVLLMLAAVAGLRSVPIAYDERGELGLDRTPAPAPVGEEVDVDVDVDEEEEGRVLVA